MATKQAPKPEPKKWSVAKTVIVFCIIVLLFMFAGIAYKAKDSFSLKPAIAVIQIDGEIGMGAPADPSVITKLIEKADKEITVKAIILDINSPGGSVVASEEIASAVKNAKKPTVALIREVGASGAFWIATSADKVIADPASITGSIGVTASYLSFEDLMQKYGITYNRLVTGKYKDAGAQFKELTSDEQQMIMEKITYIKNMFVYAIATNRNLSFEYVDGLADGSIWLGHEAKSYGMIDILGGGYEAQKAAEELAGLKESRIVEMKKEVTLFDLGTNVNSMAYWAGRGIGAEFMAVSDSKQVPEVSA